jgi:plastocyanin
MTRVRLALLVLLCAGALVACGTGDSSQTASNNPTAQPSTSTTPKVRTTAVPMPSTAAATVHLRDNLFDPAKVEIKAGEAVEWHWEGKSVHNVHGPNFTSKLQGEGTFEHVFTKSGTFDYRCDVHPEMKASVVVS